MGRPIPAGTGIKYYRNVNVAPGATENRKVGGEFDELAELRRRKKRDLESVNSTAWKRRDRHNPTFDLDKITHFPHLGDY